MERIWDWSIIANCWFKDSELW